jgi:anaerobic selenocysteine-containing dehydrogenase
MDTRDAVVDIWGPRAERDTEPDLHSSWTSRCDEGTVEVPEKWVQSACMVCSHGCGMDIGVKEGRIVGVRGREHDRVNKVRLYARLYEHRGHQTLQRDGLDRKV